MLANSNRNSFGFTLIEILVSLSIMGIALMAVLKSSLLIQESLLDNNQANIMAMLGSEKISQIELQGPENIYQWRGNFDNQDNYVWEVETKPLFNNRLKKLLITIYPAESPEDKFFLEKLIFE
ncbi:MAG TPA: prepilin-type N-terminal cleavage/methylation domain-containing protein [Desulfohalobiaceae bacterium]|nr:prepilin-type N-terminal cleavage/methylation domain-containing protein [Desulfohalobiaceae bacterium]